MSPCPHHDYTQRWTGGGVILFECIDCGEVVKSYTRETWDALCEDPWAECGEMGTLA